MNVLYVRESKGSVDAVGKRLEEAVKAHKFGVIAIIDLKGKMVEKGVEFRNACKIYEVCNPIPPNKCWRKTRALPPRCPVALRCMRERGRVKVATMLPTETLGLFGVPDLAPVAQEVEKEIKAMIDEAVAV